MSTHCVPDSLIGARSTKMNNKAPALKVLTASPGRAFINKDNECHRCPDRSWKRVHCGQGPQ